MSGNWRRGAPPPPVGGPTGAFGRPYSGGVPARPHGPPQPQAQAGPTEWERARGAHAQPRQPEANVDVVIPPCPSQFPQIQSMPVEELRRLVNDSSAFDGFIRDHHYRQGIERELTKVRDQVSEMQARNSKRQAELAKLTGGNSGMSLEEQLTAERAALKESQARFDAWLARNSRDALQTKLEDAVEESRGESAALTERFNAGDMPYNEYISQYREVRRQFHDRVIKLERFKKLYESSRSRT